jgi:hypothetical protein
MDRYSAGAIMLDGAPAILVLQLFLSVTIFFRENYGLITSYFHPIFIAVLHEMY